MNTDPLRMPSKIGFVGDWHGNSRWGEYVIQSPQGETVDTFLHLGDFGYHFTDIYLDILHASLKLQDQMLLFVDGNHEDFPYLLSSFPYHSSGLRQLTPNIFHIPRGFAWEWDDIKFMGFGGAYSVDRRWRTVGASWWLEETIKEHEIEAVPSQEVDVLLMHDCPSNVPIPGLSETSSLFPPEDIYAANLHRNMIRDMLIPKIKPSSIYHGHYHKAYKAAGGFFGYGRVEVTGLDCDGGNLLDNLEVVDLWELKK